MWNKKPLTVFPPKDGIKTSHMGYVTFFSLSSKFHVRQSRSPFGLQHPSTDICTYNFNFLIYFRFIATQIATPQ